MRWVGIHRTVAETLRIGDKMVCSRRILHGVLYQHQVSVDVPQFVIREEFRAL